MTTCLADLFRIPILQKNLKHNWVAQNLLISIFCFIFSVHDSENDEDESFTVDKGDDDACVDGNGY